MVLTTSREQLAHAAPGLKRARTLLRHIDIFQYITLLPKQVTSEGQERSVCVGNLGPRHKATQMRNECKATQKRN